MALDSAAGRDLEMTWGHSNLPKQLPEHHNKHWNKIKVIRQLKINKLLDRKSQSLTESKIVADKNLEKVTKLILILIRWAWMNSSNTKSKRWWAQTHSNRTNPRPLRCHRERWRRIEYFNLFIFNYRFLFIALDHIKINMTENNIHGTKANKTHE